MLILFTSIAAQLLIQSIVAIVTWHSIQCVCILNIFLLNRPNRDRSFLIQPGASTPPSSTVDGERGSMRTSSCSHYKRMGREERNEE